MSLCLKQYDTPGRAEQGAPIFFVSAILFWEGICYNYCESLCGGSI